MPGATPRTAPDDEPIVASRLLLVVQVPPGVGLESVVPWPAHTVDAPLMAPGDALTVIGLVTKQPLDIV